MALIAFFNYYYTFLQLEPKDLADSLKRQARHEPQAAIRPCNSVPRRPSRHSLHVRGWSSSKSKLRVTRPHASGVRTMKQEECEKRR